MPGQEFIIVKYGDDEKKLFNPHCRTSSLLESIRRNCLVTSTSGSKIDLMAEDGHFAQISLRPYAPANLVLDGGQTYVLINIIADSKTPKYESLLNNLDKSHPDLAERLETLSCVSESPREKVKHTRSSKKTYSRRSSLKLGSLGQR